MLHTARFGGLEVLRWAREHGWDAHTCSIAALFGHLAVLQYAREHECPWDSNTCHNAARGGYPGVHGGYLDVNKSNLLSLSCTSEWRCPTRCGATGWGRRRTAV